MYHHQHLLGTLEHAAPNYSLDFLLLVDLAGYECYDLYHRLVFLETLVWKQGMEDWAPAQDVPEIADLFASIPPPLPPQ